MKKVRDLTFIVIIYILAYAAGFYACEGYDNIILKLFMFDTIATVITFLFSVMLKNSSVYDAYWSLTPMVISICLLIGNSEYSVYQIAFFVIFNIWSLRLTLNWVSVFTDFSYEDWRYRKYRDETPKLLWPLVNFFGIHYMPTLVVFAGMLPLFEIITNPLGIKSVPGMMIMLAGICLEYFADRQMHLFLASENRASVCNIGLWRYSRHPNYLGEISVWLGVYLTMLPYSYELWYYGIGFLSIAVMFNVVSIPLMEKRQLNRRSEYSDYIKKTSRLLLRNTAGNKEEK